MFVILITFNFVAVTLKIKEMSKIDFINILYIPIYLYSEYSVVIDSHFGRYIRVLKKSI